MIKLWVGIGLLIASIVVFFVIYFRLIPEPDPSHWYIRHYASIWTGCFIASAAGIVLLVLHLRG